MTSTRFSQNLRNVAKKICYAFFLYICKTSLIEKTELVQYRWFSLVHALERNVDTWCWIKAKTVLLYFWTNNTLKWSKSYFWLPFKVTRGWNPSHRQPFCVDPLLTSGFSVVCKIRGALRKTNDSDKLTFLPHYGLQFLSAGLPLIHQCFRPDKIALFSLSGQCGYIHI